MSELVADLNQAPSSLVGSCRVEKRLFRDRSPKKVYTFSASISLVYLCVFLVRRSSGISNILPKTASPMKNVQLLLEVQVL